MYSLDASGLLYILNVQPDLIYIDASHDEENVFADLCAWYPFVEKRGILCGDDWGDAGVQYFVAKAVKRFAELRDLDIEIYGGLWILKKKNQPNYL